MAIKDDLKYNGIINSAKKLFWKYGFSRVSIEEICSQAAVSRMTFYKHFRNKNDLIEKLLGAIFDESTARYDSIMQSNMLFSEKVKELILLKIESTNNISYEFLSDFQNQKDPQLSDFLNQRTNASLERFKKDLKSAQINGDIRKDVKIEFIINILTRLIEMSNDPVLAAQYKSPQDMIIEIINFFFYGIFPQK